MNRYLLRSVVAISTFLLGIAVSALIHPFGSSRWERRYFHYESRERHGRRAALFPRSSLAIDAIATDPVKLLYSQTFSKPYSSQQEIVLLLDNQTAKGISAVVVQYTSRWPSGGDYNNESVRVTYDSSSNVTDLQTVRIDCGSDQTLWLWVSRVEFKDGSRWINPRHGQAESL